MTDKKQNQPGKNISKAPIDKNEVVVVKVWSWPRRLAERMALQLKHHKIGIILTLIISILVISSASFAYLYFHKKQEAAIAKSKPEPLVQYDYQGLDQAQKEGQIAQNTSDVSNYQQKINDLQTSANKTTDNKQKAQYYQYMASIELNYGTASQALIYAQQAVTLDGNSALNYATVGDCAMKLENYQLAEQSYAKAVSLSTKTGPEARSDYNNYIYLEKQAKAKL